jgi:hypothetical protein
MEQDRRSCKAVMAVYCCRKVRFFKLFRTSAAYLIVGLAPDRLLASNECHLTNT